MARARALYEIVKSSDGEVLSRHRTRQAAIDAWRMQFTGIPVQVWRRSVPRADTLFVEGTWHEATSNPATWQRRLDVARAPGVSAGCPILAINLAINWPERRGHTGTRRTAHRL